MAERTHTSLTCASRRRQSEVEGRGRLTGLDAGRDGQQGDEEAEGAVDAQEDLVEVAGL